MKIAQLLAGVAVVVGLWGASAQALENRGLPRATINVSVAGQEKAIGKQTAARINQYRRSSGLKSLKLNAKLSKVAQGHVNDMLRNRFWGHTSSNGATVLKRTTRGGYKACLVAENLSYSWKHSDIAVDEWMKSSGHRFNMMHRDFREIGVGVGPNNLLVAVFAKPC